MVSIPLPKKDNEWALLKGILQAKSESIGYDMNDDTRSLNSKSEYRNPKQIQSNNVPITETNPKKKE